MPSWHHRSLARYNNTSTAIPHHMDTPKSYELFQGRPLWYCLITCQGLQSFVQSKWLDSLFPVLAARDSHLLAEPLDGSGEALADGVVRGMACSPSLHIPTSNDPRSQMSSDSSATSPSGFQVMGVAKSSAPHSLSVEYVWHAAADGASVSPNKRSPYRDYAQSPSAPSATTEVVAGANDGCSIPTAHPANWSGKREQLFQGMSALLQSEKSHRPQTAPSSRAGPAKPFAIHGLHVPGSPGSCGRTSTTQLLREEIARSRQLMHGEEAPLNNSDQLPCVTEADDCSGWETPLQAKYAMWVATNRTRSQRDRVLEVSNAVAALMRDAGPLSTLKQLAEKALRHPVQAHKQELELLLSPRTTPEVDSAGDVIGGDNAAKGGGKSFLDEWFHVSDIALLELRVFGYLPMSLKQRGDLFRHMSENQQFPALVNDPQELLRVRLGCLKKDAFDRSVMIEALLRNVGIRQALSKWWSSLPKRATSAAATMAMEGSRPSSAASPAPPLISRSTFDLVAVSIHMALIGGSLSLSSKKTFRALSELARSDWVQLFVPVRSFAAPLNSTQTTPREALDSPSPCVMMGITDTFRNLVAKGLECPMCIDEAMFNLAMMLLVEPWMETTLPEERELALAMLFRHCFRVMEAEHYQDKSVPPFVLRIEHAEKRRISPPRPTSASLIQSPSSTRERPSTALERAPPTNSRYTPYADLVEQLDGAVDLRLAHRQARRNELIETDVTLQHHAAEWRNEILKAKVEHERPTSPNGSKLKQQPLLRKNFVPHDPSRTFGLERVMLQRLTKRVADRGEDVSLASTAQANLVVHAAKKLIPADYLHQIAKYHKPVVEQFKETVEQMLVSVASRSSEGQSSLAGELVNAHTLMDALTPPLVPSYRQPKKDPPSVHMYFVRRPRSASPQGLPSEGQSQPEAIDSSVGKSHGETSASLSALSALKTSAAALHSEVERVRAKRPTSATVYKTLPSRPSSAASRSSQVLYVSPYMTKNVLPVSNSTFSFQLSGAARRKPQAGATAGQ